MRLSPFHPFSLFPPFPFFSPDLITMGLRTMKSRRLAIFLMVFPGSYLSVLLAQNSEIRVRVTDGFGTAVQAESIKIKTGEIERRLSQDGALSLPYGTYTVEVVVRGAATTRMQVHIDQQAQIITVGMKLGAIEVEPAPCAILGRASAPIGWIRVMQIFGSYVADVPAREGGHFEVRNLACGDYLLIAMAPGKFLGTMTTRAMTLPTPIEMKAAQGALRPEK
jgi:hypothetical protein